MSSGRFSGSCLPVFEKLTLKPMKHEFLVTPPHLNQAFESGGSSGGGCGNGITRRSFIKRTGGASVAVLVAQVSMAKKSEAAVILDASGNIISASTEIGSASGPVKCKHSDRVLGWFMHEGVKYERIECRWCGRRTVRVLV